MGSRIETDRNLLFGVLALQADLIDSRQFIDACTLPGNTPMPSLSGTNNWAAAAATTLPFSFSFYATPETQVWQLVKQSRGGIPPAPGDETDICVVSENRRLDACNCSDGGVED